MTQNPKRGFRWWYVPLGCGAFLAFGAAALMTILFFVMSLVRNAPPYTEALRLAGQDTEVIAILGSPLKPGRYVMGQMQTNPAGGSANLVIPVRGPNGRGRLHVFATKTAGEWHMNVLDFEPAGGGDRVAVDGE